MKHIPSVPHKRTDEQLEQEKFYMECSRERKKLVGPAVTTHMSVTMALGIQFLNRRNNYFIKRLVISSIVRMILDKKWRALDERSCAPDATEEERRNSYFALLRRCEGKIDDHFHARDPLSKEEEEDLNVRLNRITSDNCHKPLEELWELVVA